MQDAISSLSAAGYRLKLLESYRDGKLLFAGLWTKQSGPTQKYYLGVSDSRHNELVNDYKQQGYKPVTISVVRKSGLKYTSLWKKESGSWALRSKISIAEYRDLAKKHRKNGLEAVYLNAFVDKDTPYLSVIWSGGVRGRVKRRTDLSKRDMDYQRDLARKEGLKTKTITAYELDGKTRYFAVFGE